MRWMLVLALCGALAACGAVEAAPPHTPPAAGLQFAQPPVVRTDGIGGVSVWVRLNRPLRDNEGVPGDHAGVDAELRIPGATRDIPGLYRDDLPPTSRVPRSPQPLALSP